jgi:4'-phosphopantetheinyl transferase
MTMYELFLTRKDKAYKGLLGLVQSDYEQLLQTAPQWLSASEQAEHQELPNLRRKQTYLISRYISKHTIGTFTGEKDLSKIQIRHGVFNQPLVEGNFEISISHSGKYAACIVFPDEHPMAIDLEQIDDKHCETIQTQLTNKEIAFSQSSTEPTRISYTRYWTSKEALSKVLKTGLTIPLQLMEVNHVEAKGNYTFSYFKNFTQYKSISHIVDEQMLTIVLPAETELTIQKITV